MNTVEATDVMNSAVAYPTYRVSRGEFLRLSLWFSLTLCVIALVFSVLLGQPGVLSVLRPEDLASWRTVLGGAMGLAIGAIVSALVTHWRPLNVIRKRLVVLVAWETFRLQDCVAVALLAAVGEELLFRGVMQPLLGIVPMAVMFGLLHFTAFAHVLLAGLLGLWLGWLYQWSGSLWSPIAAHLALDVVTGLLLARTAHVSLRAARGD